MSRITTPDGTEIFYNDWGTGQPIILVSGWLVSADMWEYQALFLANNGFRVIAYDRRGFGRSSQPWSGYDYDTLTNDLDELIKQLDLTDAILVGYSMGGGEVARYIGTRGSKRIAKVVLLSATTPLLVTRADNPAGVPRDVFDGLRAGVVKDRAEFLINFGRAFTGADRDPSAVTQAMLDMTFDMAIKASIKATHDCIASFSETDLRPDLAKFDIPTLVIHGGADPVVPIELSGKKSASLIPGAKFVVYEGAYHALYYTHKDRLNQDILSFARLS
ncbi:alpha/beta fold hydrolase [Paraburkholderia phenoliruptrix]|uniref:alpha/beta fold hydrolase n=1 Tax=Paraburkholderia phenoliruptrix TaxID=252970 RepID=UPI001C6F0D72|nr:alpha/beta hydrolase [Paraburkholderia phenoliruptrix]MBW9105306.1 alpha/beta hydrolase [Paraburkholderia phenoliruptrix]MBW9129952.1 alpha/beta hydrolase [Paraburkholderia ginsengiterrae]